MTAKDERRRQIRARRVSVPVEVRAEASAAICRNLLARDDVRRAQDGGGIFAVYLASAEEIDLSPLINVLAVADVPLAAPRWNGTGYTLSRLRLLSGGEAEGMCFSLREGPHGIFEPFDDEMVQCGEVAVWIVPGLAFTADGRRLGYGGGWYDRFLSAAAPDAISLGVAYQFQMFDDLPMEPHDRPLSAVIVP